MIAFRLKRFLSTKAFYYYVDFKLVPKHFITLLFKSRLRPSCIKAFTRYLLLLFYF